MLGGLPGPMGPPPSHPRPLAGTPPPQVMLERAAQLGLDTSRLVAVQQQGCAYAGLPGK